MRFALTLTDFFFSFLTVPTKLSSETTSVSAWFFRAGGSWSSKSVFSCVGVSTESARDATPAIVDSWLQSTFRIEVFDASLFFFVFLFFCDLRRRKLKRKLVLFCKTRQKRLISFSKKAKLSVASLPRKFSRTLGSLKEAFLPGLWFFCRARLRDVQLLIALFSTCRCQAADRHDPDGTNVFKLVHPDSVSNSLLIFFLNSTSWFLSRSRPWCRRWPRLCWVLSPSSLKLGTGLLGHAAVSTPGGRRQPSLEMEVALPSRPRSRTWKRPFVGSTKRSRSIWTVLTRSCRRMSRARSSTTRSPSSPWSEAFRRVRNRGWARDRFPGPRVFSATAPRASLTTWRRRRRFWRRRRRLRNALVPLLQHLRGFSSLGGRNTRSYLCKLAPPPRKGATDNRGHLLLTGLNIVGSVWLL